jgi:N6-adenosine-specific RNA methylase IME4/ParB-like chromosome segregation protein Spo0J
MNLQTNTTTDEAARLAEAVRLRRENPELGYVRLGAMLGVHKDKVRRAIEHAERRDGGANRVIEIDLRTSLEFHPLANLFPLIEGAEFDDLVADIRANGQREDIVLLDGKILDGRNRYRACVDANITPRIITFRPQLQGEPLAFVVSKNLKRRHLNESQRAMGAARLETYRYGDNQHSAVDAKLQVRRDQAAKQMGVSPRSVASAAVVRDKAAPEVVRAVDRGKLTVSQAAVAARLPAEQQRRIAEEAEAGRANAARTVIKQEARQLRERDLGDKIAAGNLALPEHKYGVILADPAWGRTVYSRDTGMDRHAANHYATATGDESTQDNAIKALSVASIAASDCGLGLWCTDAHRGVDVMRAWGFEPKSYFVWARDIVAVDGDHDICGMLRSGDRLEVVGAASTGYWRRDRCELLLIGVRGSPVCPAPGTQGESVWFAHRGEHAASREDSHSDKPDCAHEWFERHWPHTPKVELFARRARPGWARWGLDAPHHEQSE